MAGFRRLVLSGSEAQLCCARRIAGLRCAQHQPTGSSLEGVEAAGHGNDVKAVLGQSLDDGRADPFTLMRVTVRGEALQLQSSDPELKSRWLQRFPAQAINFQLADFSFWSIAPRDAPCVARLTILSFEWQS